MKSKESADTSYRHPITGDCKYTIVIVLEDGAEDNPAAS